MKDVEEEGEDDGEDDGEEETAGAAAAGDKKKKSEPMQTGHAFTSAWGGVRGHCCGKGYKVMHGVWHGHNVLRCSCYRVCAACAEPHTSPLRPCDGHLRAFLAGWFIINHRPLTMHPFV